MTNSSPAPSKRPRQTPQAAAHLGRAIRQRRKALGMKLTDLAGATDLTTGFISQIERDISSPSLSSLMRVAAALHTSVEQLLSMPEEFHPFQPAGSRPQWALGPRGRAYEKLGPGFPGALFYPCIIKRPAGHTSEKMCHEGEVFCYLMEGEIEYHLGDEVFHMKPGDCIHHDTSVPHYSVVLGDQGTIEHWVSSSPITSRDAN